MTEKTACVPAFRDTDYWCQCFMREPRRLEESAERWLRTARAFVVASHEPPDLTEFESLTTLLAFFCDNHSSVSPDDLTRYFRLARARALHDAEADHGVVPVLLREAPTLPELVAVLDDASGVLDRLLRNTRYQARLLEQERRRLSPQARRVAKYVIENPGKYAKEIAVALSMTPGQVRKILAGPLRDLGFYNVNGKGYFPPTNGWVLEA
jgi:DNA-binding CsgD family transcriptional regulator